MKVVILHGGVVKELVPAVEWHRGFSWKDLRRVSFVSDEIEGSWSLTVLGFNLRRYGYHEHGDRLTRVPKDAKIVMAPTLRLSDLQAAGLELRLVPRDSEIKHGWEWETRHGWEWEARQP